MRCTWLRHCGLQFNVGCIASPHYCPGNNMVKYRGWMWGKVSSYQPIRMDKAAVLALCEEPHPVIALCLWDWYNTDAETLTRGTSVRLRVYSKIERIWRARVDISAAVQNACNQTRRKHLEKEVQKEQDTRKQINTPANGTTNAK